MLGSHRRPPSERRPYGLLEEGRVAADHGVWMDQWLGCVVGTPVEWLVVAESGWPVLGSLPSCAWLLWSAPVLADEVVVTVALGSSRWLASSFAQ